MELKNESADVHQALQTLLGDLDSAADLVAFSQADGIGPNVVDLLNALRDVELSTDIFRAFLKASLNDDKSTWNYTLPTE